MKNMYVLHIDIGLYIILLLHKGGKNDDILKEKQITQYEIMILYEKQVMREREKKV